MKDEVHFPSVRYFLGVDDMDEKNLCYCLVKNTEGLIDVLLSKKLKDKSQFEKEIKSISEIFNAKIIKEK